MDFMLISLNPKNYQRWRHIKLWYTIWHYPYQRNYYVNWRTNIPCPNKLNNFHHKTATHTGFVHSATRRLAKRRLAKPSLAKRRLAKRSEAKRRLTIFFFFFFCYTVSQAGKAKVHTNIFEKAKIYLIEIQIRRREKENDNIHTLFHTMLCTCKSYVCLLYLSNK